MPKVEALPTPTGAHGGYMIYCPGCDSHHVFDSRWSFNGDYDKPTFSPSMLVNGSDPQTRCHSFVVDGQIRYLSDCAHKYAGQTLNLEEITEDAPD